MFFFCFNSSHAQYHISGAITDESDEYLDGVVVRLINEKDSVINTSVTNEEGSFQMSNIDNGKYNLQFSMVGRVTQNIKIHITDNNIDSLKMVLPFLEEELPEATISSRKPQYYIYKKDYQSVIESILNANPLQSGFNFYHDRRPEWKKFCGKWQWESSTGDTIFTILLRTEIVPILVGSSKTKARGIMKSDFSVRYTRDLLVGWYELKVNDSILFTNMKKKPKITSFTRFTDTQKQCLIGVFEQVESPNTAHFTLRKNPLKGIERGFVKFTLVGKEKEQDLALWDLWIMIKNTSGYAVVEKATPNDFQFPIKVIMKKIEDW
jgi:hypothetical protein